jgi:hypothetical protein
MTAKDCFKRDIIFTCIDVLIIDLTHQKLSNRFSPILYYMKLSCADLEINVKK